MKNVYNTHTVMFPINKNIIWYYFYNSGRSREISKGCTWNEMKGRLCLAWWGGASVGKHLTRLEGSASCVLGLTHVEYLIRLRGGQICLVNFEYWLLCRSTITTRGSWNGNKSTLIELTLYQDLCSYSVGVKE